VPLSLDNERQELDITCPLCGRPFKLVTGFVYRDGDAWAVYHAQCHSHDRSEAWLDIVLGSWDDDQPADSRTFSCRVGTEGAGLVDAPVSVEGRAPHYGRMLTRADALADDRLDDAWEVVDFVVTADPTVRKYVYGPSA
jgi:hypothetical protein